MTADPKSSLGFYVDLDSCTGCKACQLACKDKNALPTGVLWRKIVEVHGGAWEQRNAAWVDQTFQYFLSLSCMHCERPICVEVCPTKALHKRADGVISISSNRCIGCAYCEMACPYGAPRFDENTQRMTKCDLCSDLLDKNMRPACVQACQMRVLDFGDMKELKNKYGVNAKIFPLPSDSLTQPSVILKLDKEPDDADIPALRVENREEM